MSSDNIAGINERVLSIPGGMKLRLIITDKHGSVRAWARKNGFDSTEVYYTLGGQRPYPEIRRKLAKSLGLEVADIDALIDGVPAEPVG